MSREICFDPRRYHPEVLECEASHISLSLKGEGARRAGEGPFPRTRKGWPEGNECSRALTPNAGLLTLRERDTSAIYQSILTHRSRFARDVFPEPRRERSIFETNPLAFSLFSSLPVACSPQPFESPESGSSGDGGSTGDAGADAPPPAPPHFMEQTTHSETPCGAGSMITDLDEDYGVCANYATGNHHLFRWNPLTAGAASSVIPLAFPPDQILTLNSGDVLITTHGTPGLSWVNPADSIEGHYPFPATVPVGGATSSGRNVSAVQPTFPKGLVEINGNIFIATSNLDLTHGDYQPGTVLRYQPGTGNWQSWPTSGFNPTSLASSAGLLLAVSSGAVDQTGQVTTPAFLDVFDPNTGAKLRTIPLGTNGAGLSGEMALSADGNTLVLGTADNSGRIVVVDLENLEAREFSLQAHMGSASRIFFSQIQIRPDGQFAFLSNFNDGRTYVVDLSNGAVTASGVVSDSNTVDALGLGDGWLRGGDLFLSKGPDILRLRYE